MISFALTLTIRIVIAILGAEQLELPAATSAPCISTNLCSINQVGPPLPTLWLLYSQSLEDMQTHEVDIRTTNSRTPLETLAFAKGALHEHCVPEPPPLPRPETSLILLPIEVDSGETRFSAWQLFAPISHCLALLHPLFRVLFKNELDIIQWFSEEAVVDPARFYKFLSESMEDRGMYIPTLNLWMAMALLSGYLCIGLPIWVYRNVCEVVVEGLETLQIALAELPGDLAADGHTVIDLLATALVFLVIGHLVLDILLLMNRLLKHSLPRDKTFSRLSPCVQFTFGAPIRAMLFVLHDFGEVGYFVYICICRLRSRPTLLHPTPSLNVIIEFQSNITLDV